MRNIESTEKNQKGANLIEPRCIWDANNVCNCTNKQINQGMLEYFQSQFGDEAVNRLKNVGLDVKLKGIPDNIANACPNSLAFKITF